MKPLHVYRRSTKESINKRASLNLEFASHHRRIGLEHSFVYGGKDQRVGCFFEKVHSGQHGDDGRGKGSQTDLNVTLLKFVGNLDGEKARQVRVFIHIRKSIDFSVLPRLSPQHRRNR